MKINHKKMPKYAFPCALRLLGSIVTSCSLLAFSPLMAGAASISGESTTILRLHETTQDKDLAPFYEYLHLSLTETLPDGTLSFHVGGWGRADLGEESSRDGKTNADLQYGFLSYRTNKNNLSFNVGRQFIAEGVATEKVDGVYLRSDLAAGFTASAFAGAPVVTEPNYKGGEVVYGGRIAHTLPGYYTIGLSALKSEQGSQELREEQGVDLWLHPVKMVDIAGRSSYNSLTNGWMEHAYAASISPLDALKISATVSQVNYRDYFHHVTTNALSLTNGILDPEESVLALGGSIGYTAAKNLVLTADYKNYDYDIAGRADYFGGKVAWAVPDSFLTGVSYHRMEGESARLRYNEYRAYATKQIGKADLSLDLIDIDFDDSTNGVHNSYSVAAAAGYSCGKGLRVAADVDFLKSPDFDQEVKGLLKVTYAFDFGKEGKSEK